MSAQDNGGPAFPEVVTEYHGSSGDYSQDVHSVGGMPLRDYFAAKAMQGICAHHDTWGLVVDEIASQSYAMADAMLKARSV